MELGDGFGEEVRDQSDGLLVVGLDELVEPCEGTVSDHVAGITEPHFGAAVVMVRRPNPYALPRPTPLVTASRRMVVSVTVPVPV